MSKCCQKDKSRLGKVGGQAVLEGVMMKAGSRTVTTCRKEDGSLSVNDGSFTSVRKKYKILDIPVLRGVVNFVEMMMLSFRTLTVSAEALGLEDEKEKVKKERAKAEGKSAVGTTDIIMTVAMILGVILAVGLFFVLPRLAVWGIDSLLALIFGGDVMGPYVEEILAGFVKVLIFVVYLCLVSLMKDIKRTFMYHGAEHKSIACFEAGEELTPQNAAKHRRFHPRCGTSFMFLMILIGIMFGVAVKAIVQWAFPDAQLHQLVYSGIQILILPLTMGVGYEILMLAGKHDNWFTRAISAPGLWVQRITTKEPTEDMLEVAIISLKCALRDEYPEFCEFYEKRAWEPKTEESEDGDGCEPTGEGDITDPADGQADTDCPAED